VLDIATIRAAFGQPDAVRNPGDLNVIGLGSSAHESLLQIVRSENAETLAWF
jgi:hypothetical protein